MNQKLISLFAVAALFAINAPVQAGGRSGGGGGTSSYSTTATLSNCNFSGAAAANPITAAFAISNKTNNQGTATPTCSSSGSSPANYLTSWSPTGWTVTIAQAGGSCSIATAPKGVTVINNGGVATAKGTGFPATVKFNCTTSGVGTVPGQVAITKP